MSVLETGSCEKHL